ncbi:uncharacterized protein LOC120269432 [Dioscorea cayenensis subsp. rotundata]|uniref:Uncharacterized protein LOC120269432 n=1 Tax=Dioscorea cayennensis subsp. rotundata TaxID=55577 RepID=A0AB40C065_DIOCR|nr:uncharacterized protein LOC120269432 [Dioscorea cayenensis subsp. rotundata]
MADEAGGGRSAIQGEISERSQDQNASGTQNSPSAAFQMFPATFPCLLPGLFPQASSEQEDHGPGIYAVPVNPYMGPMAGFPPNTLIPLTYNIPRRTDSAGTAAGENGQVRPQLGRQRQVVDRRFHFAFQLDLALLLKLAAMVFLFGHEGSRQRLILLVLFALLMYLYQTGVLRPLVRWVRQGAAPPQPRPAVPPENAPRPEPDERNEPRPEENPRVDNQNQPPEAENPPAANENLQPQPEPERRNGIDLRGFAREIQTFIIGFITSLFPGFHHHHND